ncbi:MAG: FAD-dependent oxidoreductase [Usitatibacter sp.]
MSAGVVVVGAGIVGVCCASYLRREGFAVTLVEREAPGEGTSKGNAGALSPGSCVPLAMPGIVKKVPGWLMDPEGPLSIRPTYLPKALPWLLRFVRSARPERVEEISDALRALHRHVFECYEPLVRDAGCTDLIRRTGTMVVYRSEQAFASSRGEWEMRRVRGAEVRELSAAELHDLEPMLAPEYAHGVLSPDHGYVANPHRLVTRLAEQFVADGGRLVRGNVRALRPGGDGTFTLQLEEREISADKVVIATGAWSSALTSTIGVRLPLETQRGYHVTLTDPGFEPRIPVSSSEGKFYATPMESGLRVAGTVEFAGLEAPPDYRRARRLLAQVKSLYPQVRTEAFTEWMGHRPCMPDSLPVIGPAPGHAGVFLAFGHGHNGMTSGPVTGHLIADFVTGREPFIDAAPYSAGRF